MTIPIYVLTNRKHHWLLPGFAYLFNRFWGANQRVTIVSYGRNDLQLPPNFSYHAIASENYPASQWSDGIIRFLTQIDDEIFITLLEDFWLNAHANVKLINLAVRWMTAKRRLDWHDVLRFSLWRDVKSKKQTASFGAMNNYAMVYTPPGTKYQMALQCNIWNRAQLLRVLLPSESPWQVEIEGTRRASEMGLRALGFAEPPLNYEPIFQHGSLDHARLQKIPKVDLDHITRMGWLKR